MLIEADPEQSDTGFSADESKATIPIR